MTFNRIIIAIVVLMLAISKDTTKANEMTIVQVFLIAICCVSMLSEAIYSAANHIKEK